MSFGITVIPKTRRALQLLISSVHSNDVVDELERRHKGVTSTQRDKPYDEVIDDYMAAHIKQYIVGVYNRHSTFQYDEKQLFAQGKVFADGDVVEAFSELSEHVAEHIFVGLKDIQEQQKIDAKLLEAMKDKTPSPRYGNLISWMMGAMYHPLLIIRLLAFVYQQSVFKTLRVNLPLVFGKKSKQLVAYIDGRLLDPVAMHAHLRKRCREMWDDTTGKADESGV